MEHELYTDADADRPGVICDWNGQVVLGLCRRCGRAEAQLDEPCDAAPVAPGRTVISSRPDILGYCLEWRPGDLCFYTVWDFAREPRRESARVRPLYATPQEGCGGEPAIVYRGRFWMQPKHAGGGVPEGYLPLYAGPALRGAA
jgi:hypothetical protein